MHSAAQDIAGTPATTQPVEVRREVRRERLRLLDYSEFPRVSAEGGAQLGLLVNESQSGLCFIANEAHEPGSLLRVSVRGLHGQDCRDVVARVVWCQETATGRCQLGLECLRDSKPRMVRVRHLEGRRFRA
ncbi:MAG: PilZ domain-containing protein [Myxococcota bacterium]|jgi:hypothetical protein|nr:PilZ domain-containing protein [Myxococcota bacterium]